MMDQQFYRTGEELCDQPLHYTDCGLDNVYLLNGFSVDVIEGDEAISIADLEGLHRAIGMHIVLDKKAPSGRELRFLREEMDMTQTEIADVLSVSAQSVARWEKGQNEPNGAAVFAIRVLYLLHLTPSEERSAVLGDLLERLERLMQSDETTDKVSFSYTDHHWKDAA